MSQEGGGESGTTNPYPTSEFLLHPLKRSEFAIKNLARATARKEKGESS